MEIDESYFLFLRISTTGRPSINSGMTIDSALPEISTIAIPSFSSVISNCNVK